MGWAIALLHLSKAEFGELRLPEFWAAMDAYSEERDAERRHLGELVRGATLRLWNLQVRKQDRITDLDKFWRMPWDEEKLSFDQEVKNIQALDAEERDKLAQDFLKRTGHGKQ